MKAKLIAILAALVALARTDPEEKALIKKQQDEIAKLKSEIDTLHGDSELNDPEIVKLIDEASEVLGASTPDPEHLVEPPEEKFVPSED